MILEYNRRQVFLDGQIIDAKERPRLFVLRNQEYEDETEANVKKDENQYIRIDRRGITINTSWFGEAPLFYFQKNGYFVLSSSFASLLSKLKEKQFYELGFDRIGIFESMIFDHPLRARTLFKDIKKIVPGKQIIIDSVTLKISEKTLFVLPFDKGDLPANNLLLDKAVDILDGLAIEFTSLKGKVLLPLSGGLDSRLLGCLMTKNSVSYNAITFGPKESTKPYIAKIVAKQLDVPINYLELRNDYYAKYGDEVIWLTGGLSSHMHCHLYSVLSANQVTTDNIVHGYMGGEFAGTHQPEHARNYSMSEDEAFHRYMAHHVEPAWIWSQLPIEDRDEIKSDLSEIMNENCLHNLPCHFHEYVHNVDRQFSLIANAFSPIEAFGRVIRPFATKEYAVFFNSLPFESRKNRKLFIEASRLLFPETFKIGTQDQIFDAQSITGKGEKLLSALISRLSYASRVCTKGKFIIRNPKGFERHAELLCSDLKNDLIAAVSDISDLLGINVDILENRHQILLKYRVLSLYSLLKKITK